MANIKEKPAIKQGFARIYSAFFYSIDGFCATFRNEAAFRQELFLYIPLFILLFFLNVSLLIKCLLLFANTLVLIVEILNSAIEAIVDMTSPEYNNLAKRAKDMGSAAVFLSLFIALFLWVYAIFFA